MKTIFYTGFKNTLKKIRETRKLETSILLKGKMRGENRQKIKSEKTQVYAQKPRLKRLFKNSISGVKKK
jgi:hypothetical protein